MWSGERLLLTKTEHRIFLKQGGRPAHKMPFWYGLEMHVVSESHVEEQLRAAVIEAANSEWEILVVFAARMTESSKSVQTTRS